MNKVHFSSERMDWKTPKVVFQMLEAEFGELHDVSDLKNGNAFSYDWAEVDKPIYMNPPYGKEIFDWMNWAYRYSSVVKHPIIALIPSRTDTKWWHSYVMKAKDIRFIKGRLKFDDQKNPAPFPSAIVIWGDL